MLYRKQSLYLFISIIFYFISIYLLDGYKINYPLFKKVYLTLLIACIILSISSLILFKKRKIQIFMNQVNFILNTINFLFVLLFLDTYDDLNNKNYYVIALSFFCDLILYQANKSIEKDLKIINSMNRIR